MNTEKLADQADRIVMLLKHVLLVFGDVEARTPEQLAADRRRVLRQVRELVQGLEGNGSNCGE